MDGIASFQLLRNRNIQLLNSASFMVMMGTTVIYPVLPIIQESLQIPKAQIGLLLSAYSFPAIFIAPLAGVLADLRGRKWVLAGGLLLYGMTGLMAPFIKSFTWLLVIRVIQGIGYSGVMPLVVVLIGDLFSREEETAAQGMKVFTDRVGELILPPVSGLLGVIAWQLPFLLYAIAIPLAVCVIKWLPEPAVRRRSEASLYLKDVISLALHIRCGVIFSMSSLRFFLEYAFFTYLPLYTLHSVGIAVRKGSFLFTIYAAAAMVTASQMRYLSRRWDKITLVTVSFAFQGFCLVAIPIGRSFWQLGLIMLFFGLANGIISPTQKSLLTQSAPGALRGGVVSVDRILQTVAKTVSPPVAGLIFALSAIETVFIALGAIALGWVACVSILAIRGSLRPVNI